MQKTDLYATHGLGIAFVCAYLCVKSSIAIMCLHLTEFPALHEQWPCKGEKNKCTRCISVVEEKHLLEAWARKSSCAEPVCVV